MRVKLSLLHLAVVIVVTLITSQQSQADELRVVEEKVGPIPEFVLNLNAGQTIRLETQNLSPGIDPVLHLWDVANQVEIAMDDNGGGGKSARLRKTIPHTGAFLVIVRPRNFLSAGTTDLFKNGVVWKRNVPVEGRYVFLLNLQPKEQINVLPPPLGALTHLMYLISEDGLHIELRRRGSPRSLWEAPEGTLGARTILIGVRPADGGKPMRIYRNDVKLPGADPDKDGLGKLLENQLKTCSVRTDSFELPCDREGVEDMRDTDSDGISDGWEVLGRDFSPTVYVALPTWGANPRHKDMFIEADYRRLSQAENIAHINEHMPAGVAVRFAKAYGDLDTTDPLIRLFHATLVNNPDQQPGISVHIDSGRAPEKPEHAGIYGDWGGYTAIDAVLKDGKFGGQDPGDLWKTKMHESRRGIFRYGPGHIIGGAQCKIGAIYCGYNFNRSSNAVHEMMHSLGFDHSGPGDPTTLGANCKPNYPSAVNYAYKQDRLMSDGRDRPSLNNTALREFHAVPTFNTRYIHDLQERFKLLVDPVNGNVDWNRDGVFAPADRPVRAYANFAPGIECEFTRLNRVELPGTAAKLALTQVGGHTLLFAVDPSGVVTMRDSRSDWQCDAAVKNCSGSSFGDAQVVPSIGLVRSLDAEPVVINGRDEVSLVVIGANSRIRERRFFLSGSGVLTQSSSTGFIPSAVSVVGEPSLARTRDGKKIFLVYKGSDNVVRWRFRDSDTWGPENIATDVIGRKLVADFKASPGIASAILPCTPGTVCTPNDPGLFMACSLSNTLGIFWLNADGKWESTNLQSEFPQGTIGRPSMAWVPNNHRPDFPGQFYLFVRDDKSVYKVMRTFFDTTPGQVRIRVGLYSNFDNSFVRGNSIDVMTSSTGRTPQLWAALADEHTHDDDDVVEPLIVFRPRADGIVDIRQSNYDDWTPLGFGLCETVVNPEDTVSNPIHCPKRPS